VIGWVKYLLFIMSFIIPPVGVISFWIFAGRDGELKDIAKWALLAAFIGLVAWLVCSILGFTFHRHFWGGMGRW
jgi:hypothetical protein